MLKKSNVIRLKILVIIAARVQFELKYVSELARAKGTLLLTSCVSFIIFTCRLVSFVTLYDLTNESAPSFSSYVRCCIFLLVSTVLFRNYPNNIHILALALILTARREKILCNTDLDNLQLNVIRFCKNSSIIYSFR